MIRRVAARVALVALLVGPAAGLTSTSAQASTITPAGIDATGVQDDTAALQALINGLPDGSTLSFASGGQYRIEGTLHVTNKNNLTIDGNGALFFATTTGDRTRSQWSFEGGSNIVVRDVIVRGANLNAGTGDAAYVASLEAQHAFNIWSANGIELDHVTATDVYGDFVYVGLQAGGLAKDVYIHDSTFARNGRQGISVTGADGVRIVHNTITDTRRATFDIEPNGSGWGAFNVDIEYNTIGSGRLLVLAGAGVGPERNIVFAHNTINRPFNVSVGDTSGGRRGPFTIADNAATQSWGGAAGSGALNFNNIDGLTVTGNVLPLQAGRGDYGVTAAGSCDVTVSGNTFANAIAPAIVTPGPDCASTAGGSATLTTSAPPTSSSSPTAAPTATQTSSSAPSTTSPAPKSSAISPTTGGSAQPTSQGAAGAPGTKNATKTPAAGVNNGKGTSNPKKNAAHAAANTAHATTGKSGATSAYVAPELASLTTESTRNSHMWLRGLYTAIAATVLLLGWLRLSKTGIPRRRKAARVKTAPRHPGLATTVWGSSEARPPRNVR